MLLTNSVVLVRTPSSCSSHSLDRTMICFDLSPRSVTPSKAHPAKHLTAHATQEIEHLAWRGSRQVVWLLSWRYHFSSLGAVRRAQEPFERRAVSRFCQKQVSSRPASQHEWREAVPSLPVASTGARLAARQLYRVLLITAEAGAS